jgi:hypothetical protein
LGKDGIGGKIAFGKGLGQFSKGRTPSGIIRLKHLGGANFIVIFRVKGSAKKQKKSQTSRNEQRGHSRNPPDPDPPGIDSR